MAARFILSLDCEGKWGVADQLTTKIHRQLADSDLRVGYRQVLALLDEFQVPATFAFVGLFAESQDSFHRLLPALHDIAALSPDYLAPALADIERGSRQGWHGNWAIDQLLASKTDHELALHGVTHIPWDAMDRGQARSEMQLLRELEAPVRSARTFVYPRNRVAHDDLLSAFGIAGYRQSPPPKSRLAALLTEFDIFAKPERDTAQGDPQPIPAGYFVNWQSRTRRIVPIELSALRADRMLRQAARDGGIVHFWLHPENIVTAPQTLVLLRKIVALVARYREAGSCEVMTQLDYCRSIGRPVTAPADSEPALVGLSRPKAS
jgi:peptidoglycan/xylan/chitin deacetylase (PgdA/CDA1 family)